MAKRAVAVNNKPLVVVVDTNSIFSPKPEHVVSPGYTAAVDKLKALYPELEFMATCTTMKERCFQRYSMAIEARDNARKNTNNINMLLGRNRSVPLTDAAIKSDAEKVVRREFERAFDGIIKCDLSVVEWPDVVESALWRTPPFSNDSTEKGFRDCLILESICQKHKMIENTHDIALVTRDELLGESANQRLGEDVIQICSDLDELESYLKLRQETHVRFVASRLLNKARRKFFKRGNKKSLWYSESLAAKLLDKHRDETKFPDIYEAKFGTSSDGVRYTKVRRTDDGWSIRGTTFESDDDKGRYCWSTKLTNTAYVLVTSPGTDQDLNGEMRATATWDIKWSCRVASDGRFRDTRLDGIELFETDLVKIQRDDLSQWIDEFESN